MKMKFTQQHGILLISVQNNNKARKENISVFELEI